jgi:HEAT repeat protein
VIHALANVCEQSSDHQVRSGCILALGKLESVAHISLIQKSLLSSFEREQIFAIIALGLIGDSSAIDSLVSVYDKATEDYIKSHIITALSRMKNSDDARSALVRILEEETDKTLITTAKSKIAGL